MKHYKTLTIIFLFLFFATVGQAQTANPSDNSENNTYKNEKYRFSVIVPDSWKLYGQILDDSKQHKAIADWGLPAIYSELEKTEIENSVSITAYHKTDIHSVQELIAAEYFKSNPVETALEVDSTCTNCRIIYHTQNGLEYKGKLYFVFKNEIGYVINFMATPGTYEKNLKSFEDFYLNIKFL
jgi:hypothetical protein